MTVCRRVFIRHMLPVGTAISRGLIAAAMRRAFARGRGVLTVAEIAAILENCRWL